MADEPDDIGADILAAVAHVESSAPGTTGGMAEIAKERTQATQAEGNKTAQKEIPKDAKPAGERDRGADGKFVAKDKSGVEEQPKADAPPTESKPLQEATAGADQQVAAPATWKAEAKAIWDQIPPIARAEIERREKDIARTVGEKASELNRIKSQFDEIEQVLGPRRELLALNYGGVGKALTQLFTLSDLAGKAPKDFLAWYSQNMGLDLKALVSEMFGEGTGQPPAVPPEVQQRITGLETQLQSFQRTQQEQSIAERAAQIKAVADEKDASGNLVRPFFQELMEKGEIGPLLAHLGRTNPEKSIGEITRMAYDKAIRMNDDVFSRVQSLKEQKEAEARAAKERAEAAQRAAKSSPGDAPNKFTPSSGGSNNPRDDVAAAYAMHTGTSARL